MSGISKGHPLIPDTLSIEEDSFKEVIRGDIPFELIDIDPRGDIPKGAWPVPPSQLAVLPLIASAEVDKGGILVVGLSPYRRADDAYKGFFNLVTSQIAAAIADADAMEREQQRVEALAELDRAKTAFFANVSHEFRTPLTLMLGPLRDALSNEMGTLPPRLHEELVVAQRNGLRLQKLVNALLDFSRLEAGKMQAIYRPTDIATYAADIASSFRSAIEKAGLKLEVDCPPLPNSVYVDRDLFEKLILNLVSNSFKHTFEGSIRVTVRDEDEGAVITISDTGIGIPEADIPHIFERFRRIEGSQSRTHEGSGIGLALVQEIVRLHGGNIAVSSRMQEDNHGTTFTIHLPSGISHLEGKSIGEDDPETSLKSDEAFISEALRWLPEEDEKLSAADTETTSEVREAGASILIAEDNADMRGYLQRLLSKHFIVETAPDGAVALSRLRETRPDLLLTDVMMPNMDGFELLAVVRQDPTLADLPVIMLSARAGEEAKIEGLDAGADDYLIKPISAAELKARVGAAITVAKVRRQAHEREIALRQAAETERDRLDIILSGLRDHFIVYDKDFRFTFVSDSWLRSVGKKREDMLGKVVFDEFPYVKGTDWEKAIRHSMETRQPSAVQFYSAPYDKWWDLRYWPSQEGGVCQLGLDISDVKASQFALEKSQRELQALNAELELRVSERTAELEEANGQLNGFTYSVAHDLRQNIRGLVVNAQILLDEQREKLDLDGQDNLTRLAASGKKMAELVDNLLRYARLWKEEPRRTSVDLSKLVATVASDIESTYPTARIKVEPDLTAFGDTALLRLLLENLIDNACKYVEEGQPPEIEVGKVDETFFVRDHGIGFDQKYAKKIFEPFERLDVSGKYPGTGIGLANVSRIVGKHMGKMWAEGKLGEGSTFYFTLGVDTNRDRASAALVAEHQEASTCSEAAGSVS